jgi:hypothetical protein
MSKRHKNSNKPVTNLDGKIQHKTCSTLKKQTQHCFTRTSGQGRRVSPVGSTAIWYKSADVKSVKVQGVPISVFVGRSTLAL